MNEMMNLYTQSEFLASCCYKKQASAHSGQSFVQPRCEKGKQCLTTAAHPCRSQARLFCQRCARSYVSDDLFTDLTLEALPGAEYKEQYWGGTQIFRSPVVSWLYERGWRQNFSGFGFPGKLEAPSAISVPQKVHSSHGTLALAEYLGVQNKGLFPLSHP